VGELSVDDLSVGQAARRQRVIDAALQLGSEGGYEAVQMRDVARTAGVALGLEQQMAGQPSKRRSSADGVVEIIRAATGPMERDPRLAAAMVQAASANEPSVSACSEQTTETIERMLASAMNGDDPDRRARTARVLAHVWNSCILRWANGSEAVGQIGDDLEDAARLLLD
jgi:AcrR family transcriptional regulator